LLPLALHADRIAVQRELAKLARPRKRPLTAETEAKIRRSLVLRLENSARIRQARQTGRPTPHFDPRLPITAKQTEIIAAINDHPVLIVSGETGSGKTTQLPKFCLAAGRGVAGRIGCTQPRRIAAITVAERIAEELNQPMGQSVGYKIRFTERVSRQSIIKIMTDGILLAETQSDPFLNTYDTLIIDEAHERSLNIDFLLGFLKTLIKKRRDLKLIITSATIDTEKFAKAFDSAPVVEVSGRMYPVKTRYLPPDADTAAADNGAGYVEHAMTAVDALQARSLIGDILVFMPTEQDIRDTCELIEGRRYKGVVVLPLFARLAAAQQRQVFAPSAARKIIVATNIAETSLTIPGIMYVVDTGLARISQYLPRSRTTALPVVPISRSSADQRQGRCGRVADGVCIRLYDQADYEARPLYTLPEVLRANLAEVILRMIALNLGEVERFPFIDRPADRNIADGINLLVELGAIVSSQQGPQGRRGHPPRPRYQLTDKGRLMARLPVDPRLSRMLIEAARKGCLAQVTVIAAALSIQDPRERPAERQSEADQAHALFADPLSDFVTLLNIWHRFEQVVRTRRSWSSVKKFCQAHFLSFRRMREWQDILRQLGELLQEHGLAETDADQFPTGTGADAPQGFGLLYTLIHQSILCGFLSNIAQRREKKIYTAARQQEVMIFPGSGIFKDPGDWIVAAEMVETNRRYARTAACIDSAWLESIAGQQCKYSYRDPRWERRREQVMVTEQVSLYGLIIVPGRSVPLGPKDPATANEIFIRSALVAGDLRKPPAFLVHNRRLLAEAGDAEARLRRRDLCVDENDIYEYYHRRLDGIYDLKGLKERIRAAGGDGFLCMTPEQLWRSRPDEIQLARFPDRLKLVGGGFRCSYRFDPGQEDDGITVRIPLSEASSVQAAELEWLVPGLLDEKIAALLKCLPKQYRKQLVPLSRTAAVISAEMTRAPGSLKSTLSRFIHQRFGVDIPAAAWSDDNLPEHLKMRVAVTDATGRVVKSGRNRQVLSVAAPAPANDARLQAARQRWERTGITDWDMHDLPETISLEGDSTGQGKLYPALTVEEDRVSLRLHQDRQSARAAHCKGVARLLEIRLAQEVKHLRKNITLSGFARNQAGYFGGPAFLENQLVESILTKFLARDLRSLSEFAACLANLKAVGLQRQGRAKLTATEAVLQAYHDTRSQLHRLEETNADNPAVLERMAALRGELDRLVPRNFSALYDVERLGHLVRYLKAMAIRAQRAAVDLEKDQSRQRLVERHHRRLQILVTGLSPDVSDDKRKALEEYFWMIEEYKISLFAQEVKTAFPISDKRLERLFREIERMA